MSPPSVLPSLNSPRPLHALQVACSFPLFQASLNHVGGAFTGGDASALGASSGGAFTGACEGAFVGTPGISLTATLWGALTGFGEALYGALPSSALVEPSTRDNREEGCNATPFPAGPASRVVALLSAPTGVLCGIGGGGGTLSPGFDRGGGGHVR